MGVESIGLAAWNIRSLGLDSSALASDKQRVLSSLFKNFTATAVLEGKGSHASNAHFTRQWSKSHRYSRCSETDRNIGLVLLV